MTSPEARSRPSSIDSQGGWHRRFGRCSKSTIDRRGYSAKSRYPVLGPPARHLACDEREWEKNGSIPSSSSTGLAGSPTASVRAHDRRDAKRHRAQYERPGRELNIYAAAPAFDGVRGRPAGRHHPIRRSYHLSGKTGSRGPSIGRPVDGRGPGLELLGWGTSRFAYVADFRPRPTRRLPSGWCRSPRWPPSTSNCCGSPAATRMAAMIGISQKLGSSPGDSRKRACRTSGTSDSGKHDWPGSGRTILYLFSQRLLR